MERGIDTRLMRAAGRLATAGSSPGGSTLRERHARVLIRALVLAVLVVGLTLHHGAAVPAHGATAHDSASCVTCDHGEHGVLLACMAIGAVAMIVRRHPAVAVGMRTRRANAPLRMPAIASPHLRAPPPMPEIHRLCVLLR